MVGCIRGRSSCSSEFPVAQRVEVVVGEVLEVSSKSVRLPSCRTHGY